MKYAGALLLVLAAAPTAMSAQNVPDLTVDFLLGAGHHTERAGKTWYDERMTGVFIVAGSFRLGGPRPTAPYVKLELNPFASGGYDAICLLAPDGSCYDHFPDNYGIGASLGVRHAVGNALLVGAGIGAGSYAARFRAFTDGDVSARVATHLDLVGNVRYMYWRQHGAPYWVAPITFGFRFR